MSAFSIKTQTSYSVRPWIEIPVSPLLVMIIFMVETIALNQPISGRKLVFLLRKTEAATAAIFRRSPFVDNPPGRRIIAGVDRRLST